jgi:FkbH-like protein
MSGLMWARHELSWLPAAADDFRGRLKTLDPADGKLGRKLSGLASQRLSVNQLSALRRAAGKLKEAGATFKPLRPVKVAVVGNASTELINEALVGTGLRHGLDLDVVQLPFGSLESQILDPTSELNASRPQVVWILLTHHHFAHDLPGAYALADVNKDQAAKAVARLFQLTDVLASRLGATVVFQTVPPPVETIFGSAERRIANTMGSFVAALNLRILQSVNPPHLVFDMEALAKSVGLDDWHDAIQWHAYKLPFAQRLVPLVTDHFARLLAAWKGLSRKCLVMDLDNTLWGGVIGDDGLENIAVGQGSAAGEAYLDVQRMALKLRQRGIVLAVSSKNDDAIARGPFRDHPDMLLREEHVAVFQANWSDKAANLRLIAEKLDIGLDALVLLDDNPAERAQIRLELPEVAVPELPSDPAYYPRALSAAGYFEAVTLVEEDLKRAEMYGQNAQRLELLESSSDLGTYLKSLKMQISFADFDPVGRARIAQLINKSNQFNLTTRRYSEAEVAKMEADPNVVTLQVRLRDCFGDNGMIAVIIVRPTTPQTFEIDTWLMSCRVLKRRVEEACLAELAARVKAQGGKRLIGRFIPTGRNELVRDHYAKLGFSQAEETPEGTTVWSLDLETYRCDELPFEVERSLALVNA